MFSFLTDPLTSLIYPRFCGVCGQIVENSSDGAACAECWEATNIFSDESKFCSKCGRFLTHISTSNDTGNCGLCHEHQYDKAAAAGVYHKALAASVLHLKREPVVPKRVERLLIDTFDRLCPGGGLVIVPIPLSKKRFHERGFNQASLLAAPIAKHSGWPLDKHTLIRERDTPMHRAAMDRQAREATVKNAFAVVRPKLIAGRNILLVDDLITSGATVSQCARSLKKSGAATVAVLALARAD